MIKICREEWFVEDELLLDNRMTLDDMVAIEREMESYVPAKCHEEEQDD